jgi:nitroimidazol reductase NimA-like FMN-containing flavoprotein (pyridoxamine 5'-phosphate oxidase superfamily)
MADVSRGDEPRSSPAEAVVEQLTEAECLDLVAGQEVGRIAFTGRFGLVVVPLNYRLHEGSIVFRTGEHSPMDEDLRTGLEHAEYQVAFEVDQFDPATREAWSVLIHGPAHHVMSDQERAAAAGSGVTPWVDGSKEQYIQIVPTWITGRRIVQPGRS